MKIPINRKPDNPINLPNDFNGYTSGSPDSLADPVLAGDRALIDTSQDEMPQYDLTPKKSKGSIKIPYNECYDIV
jgi:hypothetical protein